MPRKSGGGKRTFVKRKARTVADGTEQARTSIVHVHFGRCAITVDVSTRQAARGRARARTEFLGNAKFVVHSEEDRRNADEMLLLAVQSGAARLTERAARFIGRLKYCDLIF